MVLVCEKNVPNHVDAGGRSPAGGKHWHQLCSGASLLCDPLSKADNNMLETQELLDEDVKEKCRSHLLHESGSENEFDEETPDDERQKVDTRSRPTKQRSRSQVGMICDHLQAFAVDGVFLQGLKDLVIGVELLTKEALSTQRAGQP